MYYDQTSQEVLGFDDDDEDDGNQNDDSDLLK